jgi:hypothetical protein
MRVLAFLGVVLLVGLGSAQAQNQFGVQAGYTFNQMYFNFRGLQQAWVPGRQVGVHWRRYSMPQAGIQIGAVWQEKGYDIFADIPQARYRVKEYHIELPVQTAVVVGKKNFRFGFTGGMYVGYVLGRTIEQGSSFGIVESGIELDFTQQARLPWQYGLQGGLGPQIKIGSGWLQLEGKFAMALSNRYETDLSRINSLNISQQQTVSIAVVWWWGQVPTPTKK